MKTINQRLRYGFSNYLSIVATIFILNSFYSWGWQPPFVFILGLIITLVFSGIFYALESKFPIFKNYLIQAVLAITVTFILASQAYLAYAINSIWEDYLDLQSANSSLSDSINKIQVTNDDLRQQVVQFSTIKSEQATEIANLSATIQAYEVQAAQILACASRSNPEKPCIWRVQAGDSYDKIAFNAYGSKAFSLIVLNFNRTETGYKGSTEGFFFLPDIGNASPTTPQFPLDKYESCIDGGNQPCLYEPQPTDTYLSIAERFYGVNAAAGCIEQANYYYDVTSQQFKNFPESEIDGKTLILPSPDPQLCPF